MWGCETYIGGTVHLMSPDPHPHPQTTAVLATWPSVSQNWFTGSFVLKVGGCLRNPLIVYFPEVAAGQ